MPKRKPPPLDFRATALALIRSSGRAIRQIARGLVISGETLRERGRQVEIDGGERERSTTEGRDTLRRLRQEVKVLRRQTTEERDALHRLRQEVKVLRQEREKHLYEQQGFEMGTTPKDRWGRLFKKSRGLLEFLIILLAAFGLVFGFIQPFVVKTFYIPSESMVPTLEVGDRVFVNRFAYRFSEPERGDIVVFKSVEGEEEELIRRVVAVPGDEVVVRDGVLFVNGECWEEPYIKDDEFPDDAFSVPEGKVVYEFPDGSFSVSEGKEIFRDVDGEEDLTERMKRVVAMPGDEVVIHNGVLLVNGECWGGPTPTTTSPRTVFSAQ